MKEYIELGQIVNTRGLRGELKVNSFSEDPKRFEKIKKILVKTKQGNVEYEIERVGYNKNQVILKLKGIDHIDYAEKLRNCMIIIHRNDLEPLKPGQYYIVDLIGLDVFSDENQYLGTVNDIYNTGSNDIYVIKSDDGKQLLLPGIPDVIKQVDLEGGKITVHLMEGL